MNEDKLKALYEAAGSRYNNAGDYETFKTKIQNPDKRKSLYDTMFEDGYSNLGTYEEFNIKLGLDDKNTAKGAGKTEPAGKGGFWDTAVGDTLENIGSGIFGLAGSAYGLLDKSAQAVESILPDFMIRKDSEGKPLRNFDRYAKENRAVAGDLAEKGDAYDGKGTIELWKEGHYFNALNKASNEALKSLPTSAVAIGATMMGQPHLGAAIIGGLSASDKYDALDEDPQTKDLPEYLKIINTVLTGAAEGASEYLGDIPIAKMIGRIYKIGGRQAAKKAVEDTLGNTIRKKMGDYDIVLAPFQEGIEEAVSQMAENITDKYTGVDPERVITDGVAESFIYGTAGGTHFSIIAAPGKIKNAADHRKAVKYYNASEKNIKEKLGESAGQWIQYAGDAVDSGDNRRIHNIFNLLSQNTSIPEEQKGAILQYMNARKVKSIADVGWEQLLLQKKREAEQYATGQINSIVNPKMNAVVTAVVGGYDNPVQVVDGEIKFDEDGFIDKEASGQTVVILDNDGKRMPLSIKYLEEIEENIPVDAAMEQAVRIATQPIINQEQNELVRDYENGETVRVSPDNGNLFLMGKIAGMDENGNYLIDTETPAGMQQITIEPRQIVNEDNIRGIDNGSVVEYRNGKGDMVQGTVEDAHEYRLSGMMVIDGEIIPISDITGSAPAEIARQENASQLNPKYAALDDKALSRALSDVDIAIERKANPEQSERFLAERDAISAELERRKGLNPDARAAQDDNALPENEPRNEGVSSDGQSNAPETAGREQVAGSGQTIEEITARAPKQKSGEIDYDALLAQSPEDFSALYEREEGAEETRNELASVSENLGKKIQSEQKKLAGATSINRKKEARKAIAELTEQKKRIDGLIENRYAEPSENTQPTGKENIPEADNMRVVMPSPNEITDGDFTNPTRDVELPSLPENTLKIINSEAKPVVIKKEIFKKNDETHLELSPQDSRDIFANALYNPDLIGQSQPQKRNHYWLTIKTGDKNATVVIDIYPKKDAIEIVGWRYINAKGIDKLKRQAEREGGQILILSPNGGSAAALSALPYGSSQNEKLTGEPMPKVLSEVLTSETNPDLISTDKVITEGQELQENNVNNDSINENGNETRELTETTGDSGDTGSTGNDASGGRQDAERIRPGVRVDNRQNVEEENAGNERLGAPGESVSEESETTPGGNETGVSQEESPEHQLPDAVDDILSVAENETKRNEIAEAEKRVNINPSESQKDAGNYRKGHVKIHGFDISIEQPKGSVRSGVDENGKAWRSEMKNTYGYIRGTEGRDRDHIDVFIGDNPNSDIVFVVDQVNPDTGEFDEHKVMLGFDDINKAALAYMSNYEEGWQGFDDITETSVEDFRKWAEMEGRRIKPFSEYKINSVDNARLQAEQSEYLEAANERFNEELGQQIEGTLPKGHVYKLGKPGNVLQSTGFPNLPIELNADILLRKATVYGHNFDLSEIKNLPKAIQNPLAVFSYGDKAKAQNILIEVESKDGKKFIVGVSLNPNIRGKNIEVNSVRNVFPKDAHGWINWISQGKGLYYNKEKVLNFLDQQRINPADVAFGLPEEQAQQENSKLSKPALDSATKIVQEFENPKFSGRNISGSVVKDSAIDTQLRWNRESDVFSNMPDGEGLPTEEGNGITYMERILSEQKGITFMGSKLTGKAKIKTAQDVAFLFKNLESAASENVFVVLHKPDGKYSVLYLSTGTPTQSFVDIKQIAAAVKEMGASAVTLVHNHPSGVLRASNEDMRLHRALVNTLNVTVNPSVIINLDSGKFGVFDSGYDGDEVVKKPQTGRFGAAKVYQFDRVKLYMKGGERYKIKSSQDVAMFLSRQKRGTSDKVHVLVLDAQNQINRYTLLDGNLGRKEMVAGLIEEAGKHGNNIILSANGSIGTSDLQSLSRSLSAAGVKLLDYLTVRQDENIISSYISAVDEGLLGENIATYNYMHDSAENNGASENRTILNNSDNEQNKDNNRSFAENNNVYNETSIPDGSAQEEQRGGNEVHSRIEEVADTLRRSIEANKKELGGHERQDTEYAVDDIIQVNTKQSGENTSGEGIRLQAVPASGATGAQDFEFSGEDRARLEDRLKRVWFRWGGMNIPTFGALREGIQDAMLPVHKWQEALRKAGMKIPDMDDFYMNYTSMSGKIDARMDHFRKAYAAPLNKAITELMKKTGEDYRNVCFYSMLKHVPERNAAHRKRAQEEYLAQKPNATQDEIEAMLDRLPDNGLRAIVKELNGMKKDEELNREEATQFADEFVKGFEEKAGEGAIREFHTRRKNATEFALDEQYKAGLISKEKAEQIKGMFEYYVPLKGHDADTAEDIFDYGREPAVFFTPNNKRAEGRSSIAEDPFAYIYSSAQSAVHESINNRHLQQIKRLAGRVEKSAKEKGEKASVTVSRTWFVKDGEGWKVADEVPYPDNPNLSESQKEERYREAVDANDKRMEELAVKGEAFRSGTKGLDLGGVFIKPSQQRQHDVHVSVNGVMHTVRFHGSPAVARAINKANRVYADRNTNLLSGLVKLTSKATRFLSKMYTTFRPAFALYTNPVRDLQMLCHNLFVKEGAAYAGRAITNYLKAMPATAAYVAGRKKLDNKYARYYTEYISSGAKTGISNLLELRDIQKEITKDLNLLQSNWFNKHRRIAGRFIKSALINLNEWTENNARFATYITSRELGRSVQRAVSDAKEVTVNFNRKGSGAYGGAEMRAMYAFTNVGFQGLQQHVHLWKANPKRMAVAVSADAAAFAFLVPLLNSFIARLFGGGEDEDEKWEDEFARLPDYVRNNNLNIWTGKGFIHIPLPQEYRVYNAIGTNFFMLSTGRGDVKKTGEDLIISLLELIPYNPALSAAQGSIADALPTALVPAGQLLTNKTFTGSLIYNKWADEDKPLWKQVRTNRKGEPRSPQALIDFFRLIDTISGGDGVKPGNADFDPDKWNHLFNGYVGAVYKPLIQALDVARGDKELNKALVARAMFTSVDDLPAMDSYSNARYFDAAEEIKGAVTYYKGYADDYFKSFPYNNVEAFLDYMDNEHPGVLALAMLKDYPARVKKLESLLKKATGEEQKALEMEIVTLKHRLIEEYNRAKVTRK